MSDLKRLERQVFKTNEAVSSRRAELDNAINLHAAAVRAHAVALDALEQAEAIEKARELRKGKKP